MGATDPKLREGWVSWAGERENERCSRKDADEAVEVDEEDVPQAVRRGDMVEPKLGGQHRVLWSEGERRRRSRGGLAWTPSCTP